MASLRDLMKARKKAPETKETGPSQPVVNLPPPPPQAPSDLGLKPLPYLKKKRPITDTEEGEVVPPKGTKQQRVVKDQRSRRASSTESRDDLLVAEVRRGQRTWCPKLELDSAHFPWDTFVKNYHGGKAGLIAEALEQPLLLPKDMEAYRHFNQHELFLSLKRNLAMITQQVYVAEEWNKKARTEAQAEAYSRFKAEKKMGSLMEDYGKLSE
ncbi:uncharacterized protein LOC136067737 [Quercus suber]|uniref:uncharacterized protein LOC136067737 n=1 Tax=Quercus suber TaxID=58331 RepID=UPI0032DED9F4